MKITLVIDDKLVEKAVRLTGIRKKTSLIKRSLESLIAVESARRLSVLGGSEPSAVRPRRRLSSGR